MDALETLGRLSSEVRQEFNQKRRVLSYGDWFKLAAASPRTFARNSAQYLLDALEYHGRETLSRPEASVTRWKLFDCPWDEGRERLVGQERVQRELVRAVRNFTRLGRVSRLILLHGPNGSAKSTMVAALHRALEHYSLTDEGALYTFNWVFPSNRISKKRLGFGEDGGPERRQVAESFAYLDDEDIDAKIPSSLRDHPLLLVPRDTRREVLREWAAAIEESTGTPFVVSEHLMHGDLDPRSKEIYDALLTAYHGDFDRVLQHIQVERVFVSRRYRRAAISVEPQIHVDAGVRQVTADRSLDSLPPSLHNVPMYQPYGDLVDANRGIIEFNDLLDKPLDTYKYLMSTCEKSSVALPNQILHLDVMFLATTNEKHLQALKEHPYFASFRGRLELIRVPYLLDYQAEQQIYDDMLAAEVATKEVAPHTTWVAALWAVLTRMKKPKAEAYPASIRDVVGRLTPLQKAELYANGTVPRELSLSVGKELRALVADLMAEHDEQLDYEGSDGASPREMKIVLLNAANSERFATLSPLAVFEELEQLVRDRTVYEFLRREPVGEYYKPKSFIDVVRQRYLDVVDDEVREAFGLVSSKQFEGLFARYVTNVSYLRRGEKMMNPRTGALEEPDTGFVERVEKSFGGKSGVQVRDEIISGIGAWRLDNPSAPIRYEVLFPQLFNAMRNSFWQEQASAYNRRAEELLRYMADGGKALTGSERERCEEAIGAMKRQFGYSDRSAHEALGYLFRSRRV
jgi:predicted Ser/Thr protein kinase